MKSRKRLKDLKKKNDYDNEVTWKKLYSKTGSLIYEGFTIADKAYGAGAEYYENGMPLHQGIFGIKGLLIGKEYYTNGQVRFEGTYKLNKAYGQNYPECGTWYSEDGKELYQGRFCITQGGVGYPTVVYPEHYGTAAYPSRLEEHLFMWADEERLND